jgi:hypothetical protein
MNVKQCFLHSHTEASIHAYKGTSSFSLCLVMGTLSLSPIWIVNNVTSLNEPLLRLCCRFDPSSRRNMLDISYLLQNTTFRHFVTHNRLALINPCNLCSCFISDQSYEFRSCHYIVAGCLRVLPSSNYKYCVIHRLYLKGAGKLWERVPHTKIRKIYQHESGNI